MRAQRVIDRAVALIDVAHERDDPSLKKNPKIKILVQNALRLQRTLWSTVIVMLVTVSDWDLIDLLGGNLINTPTAPTSRKRYPTYSFLYENFLHISWNFLYSSEVGGVVFRGRGCCGYVLRTTRQGGARQDRDVLRTGSRCRRNPFM